MKILLIKYPFGILAFNDEDKLVDKVLFSRKPQEAAEHFVKVDSGKISDLIDRLKKRGYKTFVFNDSSLANSIKRKLNIKVEIAKVPQEKLLSLEEVAVKAGFVENLEEFRRWLHDFNVEVTKLRVKGAVENRDLLVAQAIQTLDDLDKTINLFMSRIREWYGIHFPELNRLIEKHETYAKLVFKFGNKMNMNVEDLMNEEIQKGKAQQIAKAAEKSMGADLPEHDLEQIQSLCKSVLELYSLRRKLEDYLDKTMDEVAPNVKAIVGSLLGARLIALAGGLTNLAKMPASTIQVLGAEKALFRSLKTGTRPPKHGIIFQHSFLREAKRWQRGKIARALAGKLAIAARTDAFGGRFIGEDLKIDLEKRVEEILEKYAQPTRVSTKKGKKRRRKKHGRS